MKETVERQSFSSVGEQFNALGEATEIPPFH